jgi:hypothetical protein
MGNKTVAKDVISGNQINNLSVLQIPALASLVLELN